MKLYYYRTGVPNFGDELNAWLWPKLIPELLDPGDGYLFIGIGTILSGRIPASPRKIVFGAGTGYGSPPVLDDTWEFYCVRGPLTAAALGLPPDLAITDPAVLVSTMADLPAATGRAGTAFIPHFETGIRASLDGLNLQALCADAHITFIDPRGSVDDVLSAVRGCEMVIAEAMHGAIIADALRIPWIPVRCDDHILDFKWRDWCESLQLKYEPAVLGPSRKSRSEWAAFLETTSRHARPMISREDVLGGALERLQDRLELLRRTYQHLATANERTSTAIAVDEPVDDWSDARQWWEDLREAGKGIDSVIAAEAAVIFVDDAQWADQLSAGRNLIPFLERDGQYWGAPPDSAIAIEELERLRAGGARFIVFARPAFWWLDHYVEFAAHLRACYRTVLNDERLIGFSLDQ